MTKNSPDHVVVVGNTTDTETCFLKKFLLVIVIRLIIFFVCLNTLFICGRGSLTSGFRCPL